MDVPGTLFIGSSIAATVAALAVIMVRDAVHAVLSLILCFVMVAFTWFLIEAEFLAIALILTYVGAVMILFLFVVMMFDRTLLVYARSRYLSWIGGACFGFFLIWILLKTIVFIAAEEGLHPILSETVAKEYTAVQSLGHILLRDYSLAVACVGIILVGAMVAGMALLFTRTARSSRDKRVSLDQAAAANKKDRLRLC